MESRSDWVAGTFSSGVSAISFSLFFVVVEKKINLFSFKKKERKVSSFSFIFEKKEEKKKKKNGSLDQIFIYLVVCVYRFQAHH